MARILSSLTKQFFTSPDELGVFEAVEANDLTESYQALLAHHDHMTVTVEAWHNSLVDVHVLDEKQHGDSYARKIVLTLQRGSRPVQFGIMRIDFGGLPEIVRLEIQSQALPLGRIMIRHHLMREVELCQLWRVNPGPELRTLLRLKEDVAIYGRTARILVSGKPAVELLEIVTA
jgi:chorismate-pyruvate lyase